VAPLAGASSRLSLVQCATGRKFYWATSAAWRSAGAIGTIGVLTKQEFMLLMVGGRVRAGGDVGDVAGERLQMNQEHSGVVGASLDDAAESSF